MLKSTVIVIGSYLLSVVLVLATDPLLSGLYPGDFARGRVPSTNPLIASTAFFVVISIFCAWLCARWSAARATRNVLWFFILGEVLGAIATIPNWNKGWPHWYSLAWLAAWPVSCWIGLQLSGRRAARSVAAMS